MKLLFNPLLLLAFFTPGFSVAGPGPVLHGYGARSCVEYLDTWRRWEAGQDEGILDHFGYSQWLAGLVTGLSLATGEDVLRGADVEGMMRRVRLGCEEDRKQDVFGVAGAYLRELSLLP